MEQPLEGIDGDPETIAAARDSLAEGAARLVDELRLSLEYYARAGRCGADRGRRRLRTRDHASPGSWSAFSATSASGSRSASRGPWPTWTPTTAARLTLSFGLALEE